MSDEREKELSSPEFGEEMTELFNIGIKAAVFENAAAIWRLLKLPDFEVKGYLDGEHKTWTVPEVLEEAARLVKERS